MLKILTRSNLHIGWTQSESKFVMKFYSLINK